jgi:hypothetical protein
MLPARKEEVFPVEGDSKKVEERLGALEVSVAVVRTQNAHIMTDVSELKGDVKELRTRMTDGFQSVHKEFQSAQKELSSAKIWALFIAAAMLGVIARGFHWI